MASIPAFFAVFTSTSLSPKKMASFALQLSALSVALVVVGSGFHGMSSLAPVIKSK